MLTLKKKRCEMGVINNRIEKHGDDNVTAFDIPITYLANPDDLEELLGKDTHDIFYKKVGRSYEPRVPELGRIPLKHDFDADVELHLGKSDIEFEKVHLKSVSFELMPGGESSIRFTVQVRPKNQHLTRLLDAQNCELKISVGKAIAVDKAKRAQQELPLEPVVEKNGSGKASGDGDEQSTPAQH